MGQPAPPSRLGYIAGRPRALLISFPRRRRRGFGGISAAVVLVGARQVDVGDVRQRHRGVEEQCKSSETTKQKGSSS